MRPASSPIFRLAAFFAVLSSARLAKAYQPETPSPTTDQPDASAPLPLPAKPDPTAPPPAPPLPDPGTPAAPPFPPSEPNLAPGPTEPAAEEPPERMSEGRAIVVAWNTGFQWGLAPGVIFTQGRAGFSLGLRLGWGFDTGSVIVVPGVRIAAYFTDPNVYLGMPNIKLVFPIDRFAPFVEGGGGVGHVAGGTASSATGAALFVGGGFMIHITRSFALGAEVNYQAITGTTFKAVGVGPIIAFAF